MFEQVRAAVQQCCTAISTGHLRERVGEREKEHMRETWIDQHAVYLVCHSLPLRSFARYVVRYLTYAIMPQRLAEGGPVVGLTVWTQGIMNKYSSPPPCRTRLLLASRSEVSTTAVGNEGRGLLACVDAGYDQYGGGRNDWGGTCMYEHMSSGLHRLLGRASERAAQKRNRLCTALKSSPQPP